MIKHKKIYKDFFMYAMDENVPSEISGCPADHIHHIKYKSRGGGDDIENLMAVTRGEHGLIHDVEHYEEDYLRGVHLDFIRQRRPDYKIDKDE